MRFQRVLTFLIVACANTVVVPRTTHTQTLSCHLAARLPRSQANSRVARLRLGTKAGQGGFYQPLSLVTINVSDLMRPSSRGGRMGGCQWRMG